MALYTSTTPQGYTLELSITTQSQDVANNKSVIAFSLKLIANNSGHNDWSGYTDNTAKVTISGASKSWSGTYDFRNKTVWTIISGTTTRTHNADGTLSLSVYGEWNEGPNSNGIGDDSVSGTYNVKTIPRASDPSFSASAVDAGDSITINTNRASTSFTHNITYKIGSQTGTVANGVGESYAWTTPLSLLNAIPNATSGTITLTTKTYSGGTYVGEHVDSFTIRAGAGIIPSISDITHAEANTDVSTNIGAYVQHQTQLNATIVGASGIYGSTITNYHIAVAGQSINASSGTTPGAITTSGSVPVVATVTDSRGRTATRTEYITVLAWAAPQISTFTLQRAASTGTPDEQGTYVRVNLADTISSLVVGGTEKNTHTLRLWSRARGTTTWTDKGTTSVIGTSYNGYILASPYSIEQSWEFRIDVVDSFTTTSAQGTTATATIFMHWSDNGLGVGKFWERGALDVAGQIYQKNGESVASEVYVDNAMPIGGACIWFLDTVPSAKFALAQGQLLSTTEYPDLFALYGYTFGGSGTSFAVPDMRRLVPVGHSSGDDTFGTLGAEVGAKLSSHEHTLGDDGYAKIHLSDADDWLVADHTNAATWQADVRTGNGTITVGPSTTTWTQGTALGGTTHYANDSTIQPSRVVNYLIRAKK